MNALFVRKALAAVGFGVSLLSVNAAQWEIQQEEGKPGKQIHITHNGKTVARFIYGDGQIKPYLHVFAENGDRLTNGGLDEEGQPAGQFPHHRGIFIGWNKITSELGSDDLWHMTKGTRMRVEKIEKLEAKDDRATLIATIGWRSGTKDKKDNDLLITETRRLDFTRPKGGGTQVDAQFVLQAARDLKLGGDLQHAGIHFRADNEVNARKAETAYVWEPDVPGPSGKAVSKDLKWCRLLFPIKQNWYQAVEFNSPANPVEELSWRDYGRFGFFFQKELKADEKLRVEYRFLIQKTAAPSQPGKLSEQEIAEARKLWNGHYTAFAAELAMKPAGK